MNSNVNYIDGIFFLKKFGSKNTNGDILTTNILIIIEDK